MQLIDCKKEVVAINKLRVTTVCDNEQVRYTGKVYKIPILEDIMNIKKMILSGLIVGQLYSIDMPAYSAQGLYAQLFSIKESGNIAPDLACQYNSLLNFLKNDKIETIVDFENFIARRAQELKLEYLKGKLWLMCRGFCPQNEIVVCIHSLIEILRKDAHKFSNYDSLIFDTSSVKWTQCKELFDKPISDYYTSAIINNILQSESKKNTAVDYNDCKK